jgi:tetratricopeptide (TPR) repeat protein
MSFRSLSYILVLGCLAAIYGRADAQTTIADSLWNTITEIPSDTAKVNAVIRDALWLGNRLKNSEQQEALLEKGLALATRIGYRHGIAECENMLGVFNRENSRYEQAIGLHQKALQIAEQLKDSNLIAYSLNNLGVAYRRLDQNEQAFQYHLRALKIAEATGDKRNQTVAINSIGNIQLSLGNYQDAIGEFTKALQIETAADNNLGIAINYANLGASWEGLGHLDKAIPLYEKSLSFNEKAGSYTGIAICCNLLGNAYLQRGNYDRAIQFLRRALSVHNQVHDKINVAENLITIGKILMKQHRPDSAMASMREGLAIAREINSRTMMIEGLRAISDAEYRIGDREAAYKALEQAYGMRDSLYVQQAAPQMAKMRALYELNKKDNQIKLLEQGNQIKQLELNRHRIIAIALVVILILVLILLILFNRQRQIRMHRAIVQYELQALRSQMNPHFIFNSLNSIHKFIWSNEQESASEYLAKFSKLMRLILENTRHKTVVLSNEIEFLHLYLELESVRCNHSFHPEIEVSSTLKADETMIPSMIIQPFVENAIWHGLVHRQGSDGKLCIRFYQQDELLVCEIQDNGIGRKKAQQIKARKKSTHQSIGIEVTTERIGLLKQITGMRNTRVDIVDMEKDQVSLGTKVILHLPMEYAY